MIFPDTIKVYIFLSYWHGERGRSAEDFRAAKGGLTLRKFFHLQKKLPNHYPSNESMLRIDLAHFFGHRAKHTA